MYNAHSAKVIRMEKQIQLAVRVPKTIKSQCQREADKNRRSLSGEIEMLLREALAARKVSQ